MSNGFYLHSRDLYVDGHLPSCIAFTLRKHCKARQAALKARPNKDMRVSPRFPSTPMTFDKKCLKSVQPLEFLIKDFGFGC